MTAAAARKAQGAAKARPYELRLLTGRGNGRAADGKIIPVPPAFTRATPEKPEGLNEDAEFLWDLVVAQWEPLNLMRPMDAASLLAACENYARWKQAVRWRYERGLLHTNAAGTVCAAPWIGIEEKASREFRAWCAEFGLTPAAENNVAGMKGSGTVENVNPFE